jgi:hypothetical protein
LSFANERALEPAPEDWLPYEHLLRRFEQAWERGPRPVLDDYLPAGGPRALLVELVHTDLEYRLKAGEAARVEDYWRRFPELEQNRTVALGLIEAEYELRWRREPDLTPAEYRARFPAYGPGLLALGERWSLGAPSATRARGPGPAPEPGAAGPGAPAGRSRLGKYELLEVVGQGAFGVVYRARDTELGRTVAVKVPRAPGDGARGGAGALPARGPQRRPVAPPPHRHPARRPPGGRHLRAGLRIRPGDDAGGAPPGRPAGLPAGGRAGRWDYAHRHGVVHRDVKPANLLLDDAGQPHVLDFGLAKREAGEKTLTREGDLLGTPAYMSPEQARGEAHRVDARSDIYSLGVVLYEMLTGELPFRGNARMLLRQALEEDPPPPRALHDRVPRDLETVCLKCLEKEPHRRYPSAGALAQDLRRFLAGEPIAARPAGVWERGVKWVRRRPQRAALAGVGVLALAAALAGGAWYAGQGAPLRRAGAPPGLRGQAAGVDRPARAVRGRSVPGL